MSDTVTDKSRLWVARESRSGMSRERVAALLEPPISSKTLERWEKRHTPAPMWRLRQLAALYNVALYEVEEAA